MELQVERLCKSYVYSRVLKEVSFHIKEGMYGLLGKNGAGKTTLMKILAGILEKSSGEIYYDGNEVKDINASLRVTPRIAGSLRRRRVVRPTVRCTYPRRCTPLSPVCIPGPPVSVR